MSAAPHPWLCPCETDHRHGCPGHVEVCSACGWYGGNLPGRPCTKCEADAVIVRGCEAWPVRGAPVCVAHGGASKQVKHAAKRRLAIAKADAKLRELEYEPVADPVSELADVAGQAKALMEWAGARVAELQNALTYTDGHDVDQLRAEVGVYERAIDRTAKLVEACARLGLDERRVALEEGQAELAVAALRLALERAGLAEPVRQAVIDAWSVALPELEKANSEGSK